jgi:lipopolysaccharide transport system permease protein
VAHTSASAHDGGFRIIFARVAGISTGEVPAPLFYLSGLLAWNYFAQNITTANGTFLNNQGLFSKVWFPRLVVPMAAIASNLVSFALQLIPFIAFASYYAVAHGFVVFTGGSHSFRLPRFMSRR